MTDAVRERKRRYRESHREELRAKGREYARLRRQDPEVREAQRQASARARAERPEQVAEIRARFKERHPGYEAAAMKRWREAHPERNRENARASYIRTRVGSRPYKPQAADVSPEAQAKRQSDYLKRWCVENRERYLATKANTQLRRRARQKGAPNVEMVDRLVIFERDGGKCHICRRPCSRKKFHLDHLVPLSKGGDHTAANLAVAHPACNIRRGAGRLPAQLRLVG